MELLEREAVEDENMLQITRTNDVVYIDVNKIIPNPYQPRRQFDRLALEELSYSIKKYGVMQPISVRRFNSRSYELIVGERRLKAAKLAGFDVIPAIVMNISDCGSVLMTLLENMQREGFNYIEEAEIFQLMMVDYGFSQEEIADMIGKTTSYITDRLSILQLDSEIKELLIENRLSVKYAVLLLKLKDKSQQTEVLDKVIKYGLNPYRTECLIKKSKITGKDSSGGKIKGYINDIRIFTNTIKNAVNIMREAGVATSYSIERSNDGYEINIKVTI